MLLGCGDEGGPVELKSDCVLSETREVEGERIEVYRTSVTIPVGAEVTGYYVGWTAIDLDDDEVYYDPFETGEITPQVEGDTASYVCRTIDEYQMLVGFYDEVVFVVE